MFADCLSNPINMVDHSGKKPGDWFDSIDEAARDAAYYINEASISEDTEYSSCIYTKETTRKMRCYFQFSLFGLDFDIAYYITLTRVHYSYTNPIPGTTDGVEIPDAPEGMESAAFIHTHASYNPYYRNDDFSWDDIVIANYYEVPIYVATPFGSLRRYDPADQTNIIVYNDIPYDRNHPYR